MGDGITPLTPAEKAAKETSALKEKYPVRVLIALDQFANVLTFGHPDETISSRAARAATQGKWWGVGMSKFLDVFQRNHGAQAIAGDAARGNEVAAIEDDSGVLPK